MASPLTILADCGLGDGLVVERFHLDERVDDTYLAVVDLRLEELDPDLASALGDDATVTLERDGFARRLLGIVRAASTLREDAHVEEAGAARLEIVPALWMLSMRRDTRMFQSLSVPDILEAVLGEGLAPYGREVELSLGAEYPVREYCLQYQETDLAFVSRLMEEEGISYSFDHSGDVEKLVLRDENASYERAEGAEDPVPLETDRRAMVDVQSIVSFERVHASTVTKVALRDHDFTTATPVIEDAEGGADALGKERESYEHGFGRSLSLYDYAGTRYGAHDAARQKLLRLEAHLEPGLVGRGLGRVLGFVPGATFELAGHPTPGVDGEYLITAVEHANEAVAGGEEPYHNRFECIPLAVPHRPRRLTPSPRIAGIQTAVVTGPAGEEIHTDEHGRVKVQFHWDRQNPADETSSCWVRVQQKWAGAGWGFWWLPRIGMEVVVQFIDGDPDRPLVTGAVYDGTNATPYALPDEKTKSTIKSNSSPGGGGFNEFRFEDKSGSEQIFTHAQKDYNEVVENDHTTLVHGNQTIEVDNDQTQTIHNNQTERVDVNQSLEVGGNRTVHVEGDFDETVDGTETRHVVGDVTETFDGNETRDVAASLTETFSANETRSIGGSQTETIGASHDVTIGGDSAVDISGAQTEIITGGITLTTAADWNVTATGGLVAILPAGFNLTTTGGFQISASAGVKQIDTAAEILAGIISTDGAVVRAMCGAKTEAFGMNISAIGSGHSVVLCEAFVGITVEMAGSALETLGAKIKAGALRLASGPDSSA